MFHKALNSFKFDCEITFESVLSNKGKVFCSRKQLEPLKGLKQQLTDYEYFT